VESSPAIERLVASLKRLPGIGEKSATRLTFFLLGAPDALVQELAQALGRLKQDTVLCESCFNLTDESPCAICRSETRDASQLCVVEEPADLASIERSQSYSGRYFVLGGALSPIEGIGPKDLRIADLEARVREGGLRELVLAMNPTAEGDATAHFIAERVRSAGILVSRIACGMPLGGDFEYADHVTVGRSLGNRQPMD
jgi:recombination protein RecR